MWNPPTKKQLQLIPELYSQENVKDKKIYMKFFIGNMTWYVAEINHEDTDSGYPPYTLMFTYVVDENTGEGEWGYTSLIELKDVKQGFVQVDREIYDVNPRSPKRLSEMIKING